MIWKTRMDGFDQLPDSLIILIFNCVSDIKTLICCRAVSKRFNSLVPQTESLSLTVDRVISPESDSESPLLTFLKIFLKSFHDLLRPSLKQHHRTHSTVLQNSPAHILTKFTRIRNLQIELPAGDLTLEKGVTVKWTAKFGKTLKSCVIFGFKSASATAVMNPGEEGETDADTAGWLKTRVMWTISALIVASSRHFMLKEVVREHEEMERLVLIDRQGEGTVVMDKEGMEECRLGRADVSDGGCVGSRTMVPCMSMRMRQEPRLVLEGGIWLEGATLVVVRPSEVKDDVDDDALASEAFDDSIYREAVQKLLKGRSYLLEMNSF